MFIFKERKEKIKKAKSQIHDPLLPSLSQKGIEWDREVGGWGEKK